MAASARLGRVLRWAAAERGPRAGLLGLEQHKTDTLVLCLAGAARIEDGRNRLDLAAGDALVIRPGAWHRHAALRPGALVYRQGVIAGRSDFFLEDPGLSIVAAWPEQPARNLLAAIGEADDEDERRARLRALLAHLAGETATPLPTQHPVALAMEYALWENLHRPDAVARVVQASGLSRVQAWRIFRARFGCGIASAVRRERMQLARVLLGDGLAVGAVAQRCGIADRSVFARAYRRQWGEAPTEGRR
jgi:AraC-like DNA-binding protein